MHRSTVLSAITSTLFALAASPAFAQSGPRSAERAIESNTETVPLPMSVPSSMSFKPCGTCKFVTLRVDESTRFIVGTTPVTLAELQRHANRGSNNLDVFYDEANGRVTRVILRAAADPTEAAGSKNTQRPSESPRTKQ